MFLVSGLSVDDDPFPQSLCSSNGRTGTSDILEKEQPIDQTVHSTLNANLKYDRSGAVPVLLIPQPSDDPNDPLVCVNLQ